MAGLGRILSLPTSFFCVLEVTSVVVLVDIDTVRLLVVVVEAFFKASATFSRGASFRAAPMTALCSDDADTFRLLSRFLRGGATGAPEPAEVIYKMNRRPLLL